jgi:peptidyl-prolyl cis-trans isomerase D
MLRFMRRHRRSLVVKGVFVILILVFVGWGVGSYDAAQQSTVASVNDIDITVAELNRAHQNLQEAYRELYGPAYTPELVARLDLPGRALEELINAALLRGEATRLGLRITDREVADEIRSVGVFSPNGTFDKEIYLRFLRASQLTDEEFVEQQRQALLTRRVEAIVTAGVTVSEDELSDRFLMEHQQINLRYVKVPWQPLRDAVSVTQKDLEAHYETHKSRYERPLQTAFSYVAFFADDFAGDTPPGEEAVAAYYEQHGETRFAMPAQVKLRQIVLAVPGEATDEDRASLRARAEELARDAAAGDFAALASAHSTDEASVAGGGDLGWVSRDDLPPAVAVAAFGLDVGAVSDPVETSAAFYVLKVEETREPGRRPLDEVRTQIETTLRTEQGRALARRAAEEGAASIAAGKTLEELAADLGRSVAQSEPISRRGIDPALGPGAALLETTARLDVGETSDVIEVPRGFVLVRPGETTPPAPAPLEEIRDSVEADLRAARAKEAAKERAQALLDRLKQQGDLDALASAEGLTIEETGPFGRQGRAVPGLGIVEGLDEDAFELTEEAPIAPSVYVTGGGEAVIAVLAEHIPADLADLDSRRETLRDGYLQRKKQTVLEAFLTGLKQQAAIKVAPGLLPQT